MKDFEIRAYIVLWGIVLMITLYFVLESRLLHEILNGVKECHP